MLVRFLIGKYDFPPDKGSKNQTQILPSHHDLLNA